MAALVKNRKILFSANRTDKHYRVFLLCICEPEGVMGAAQSVGEWVIHFLPQMIWGFYQEFLYRGILQTELARRSGTGTGMLVSTLVFTFGPLHAYHFLAAKGNSAHRWIFAAIFGIGLFFAILFKRSGNLWVVGIMHGLGDWFIDA